MNPTDWESEKKRWKLVQNTQQVMKSAEHEGNVCVYTLYSQIQFQEV